MLTEEQIINLTAFAFIKAEEDEREEEAMAFREIVTRNELKYKKDLQTMFLLQKKEVLGKLESLKTNERLFNQVSNSVRQMFAVVCGKLVFIPYKSTKDISDLFMFDVILWESNLQRFSYDHMLRSCNENGVRVYEDLQNIDKRYEKFFLVKTFDMEYPEAISYLEEQSIKLAGSVTAVTEKAVSDIIIAGLVDGLTVHEIANQISDMFDGALEYRAAAIARTEIARAANYGAISAYEQSGVVEGKEWLTAQDEKVCQFCSSMDRRVAGLNTEFLSLYEDLEGSEGGTFTNTYLDVSAPPLHVSCRCTILPVLKTIQF